MEKINIKILTFIGATFLILLVSGTALAYPGTNPDPNTPVSMSSMSSMSSLSPMVTETGKLNLSVDGLGTLNNTGTIRVQKPQGATVKEAYLLAASTGFTGATLANGDVKINNQDVNWTSNTTNAIGSYNYWADVTSIVKPIVDSTPAGNMTLNITEMKTSQDDGEILAVIFDDPNQKNDNTIVLLFGAQNVGGDTFSVKTAQPIDLTNPNLAIDMGLGISYGYQINGVQQYSIINVNGKRLTTSAGGEDDGDQVIGPLANGGLLTVGGIGDNTDNPSDPNAKPTNPRSDDELYNLLPFISQGDTNISVYTQNPSVDDNIFFGYFDFKSTVAVVGEGIVLSPPSAVNNLGAMDTVVATIQDNKGNPVVGKTVTFEIIDGPNKGKTGTATTDANGTAIFSYTGMTVGTDTIVASFINSHGIQMISNQVKNTWTMNNPSVKPTAIIGYKIIGCYSPHTNQLSDISQSETNDTINSTCACWTNTVQFSDLSLNETLGRTWEFGDGNTSILQNPVYTYNTSGTFIVNLTARNENGTNVTSKAITVSAPNPPAPVLKINDFKADVTSGFEPLRVNFTSDVSGSPTRWIWKFDRSRTQSFKVGTTTHTFEHDGVYDVTLTVKDAKGHTDTMTKKAYITVLKVPAPKANFTANVTSGKASLTVQFNDTSTNNPTKWWWNFGDGQRSIKQNPVHIYKRAGKYTVTLLVKNAGGIDTKMIRKYISVDRN